MENTGTVIEGTLRPEDLIPAFMEELEYRCPTEFRIIFENNRHIYLSLRDNPNSIEVYEFAVQLFDALNWCAEDGYYFGAHPDDGADFGFWREEEV